MIELSVPLFARLADYCGLWAVEEGAFRAITSTLDPRQLATHIVTAPPPPLVSAIEKVPVGNGRQVAVVKLQGVLMKGQSSMGGTSTVQARRDIRTAVNDPDVEGIMLAIDSPGGTVAGTADLAAEVQAARKSKPVWAHADDLAASAAYWVGSQAERFTANTPSALIGSIGTLQVVQDYSAAFDREGVKTLVISTGPLKGLGAPGSKITDEQISHLQDLVNQVQEGFDQAVMKGRSMSAKELEAVRHGGVMTATAATRAKLIDGVASLGDTLKQFGRSIRTGASAEAIEAHEQGPEREPTAGAMSGLPRMKRAL